MSQENVAIVLEGLRRFVAFDFEGVMRLWHPDSRITSATAASFAAAYRVKDGRMT
jgi:hypothetical protein